MRSCPICLTTERTHVFSMSYKTPDLWPLPNQIDWHTCNACGMLYGDGEFDQDMLNQYYKQRYGYGVNSQYNTNRLQSDALQIAGMFGFDAQACIVDFGGAGDDGRSILVEVLQKRRFENAVCVGPDEAIPSRADVIYASHVLEHVYNLPAVMEQFASNLLPDGTLIVDVPNSTGLLLHWKMPMLDFNTKHINHFTLRDLLNLGKHWGFEMVKLREYMLENAPAFQVYFKQMNMAESSHLHIRNNVAERILKLKSIDYPVNVWGLGDITWHLLSYVDLEVLDYIDNDPAYRGQTYNGKPVQERPTNDAPIVIMAQGQRKRLIENIRKMGMQNRIVEI